MSNKSNLIILKITKRNELRMGGGRYVGTNNNNAAGYEYIVHSSAVIYILQYEDNTPFIKYIINTLQRKAFPIEYHFYIICSLSSLSYFVLIIYIFIHITYHHRFSVSYSIYITRGHSIHTINLSLSLPLRCNIYLKIQSTFIQYTISNILP